MGKYDDIVLTKVRKSVKLKANIIVAETRKRLVSSTTYIEPTGSDVVYRFAATVSIPCIRMNKYVAR